MIDDDELIPLLELRKLAGGPSKPIDPSTVYRWIKRGALPRPIKVGPGTSRWLRSVTVGEVKDRMLNPPEKKKFEEFKRAFDEFPDEQRLAFVKEFEADIREMLKA